MSCASPRYVNADTGGYAGVNFPGHIGEHFAYTALNNPESAYTALNNKESAYSALNNKESIQIVLVI